MSGVGGGNKQHVGPQGNALKRAWGHARAVSMIIRLMLVALAPATTNLSAFRMARSLTCREKKTFERDEDERDTHKRYDGTVHHDALREGRFYLRIRPRVLKSSFSRDSVGNRSRRDGRFERPFGSGLSTLAVIPSRGLCGSS